MVSTPPIATSEVRFQSLFENSPELILYQNQEDTILDANPAFLALVEQPKGQVLHRNYHVFLSPDVRGLFREKLQEAFTTGQPVRFDMFAAQGSSAPGTGTWSRYPYSKTAGWWVCTCWPATSPRR